MKCWNLTSNAQGLKIIIVVVQVGVVKIYVATMDGVSQAKGKTRWNSVYHQNWWFSKFHPHWMVMYSFAGFNKNFIPCITKLLMLCFPYFMVNFILTHIN